MNLPGYLTTAQTADLLGIKIASVYSYTTCMPDFPQPERVGRSLLFRETALLAWRQKHPRNGTRQATPSRPDQ